ncbi:MAG TPA: hypothetical protein VJS44_02845 [Pyrinomonadaceae bacterium]|nr:hypothetical protein [Pyrinomonadaceae bacterium]
MSKSGTIYTKVDQLVRYLPDLLRDISKKDDEQLITIVVNAQRLERFAFIIRGMCASILRQRHQHRLSGGRGRRDILGEGIQAHMNRLAQQAGVDRKTLETDARIKDTFFPVINETVLEHIPSLRREHYVIALSAPDPHAAIRMALEKCAEPDYKIGEFRANVRRLKQAGVSSLHLPSSTCTISVCVPAEVKQLLTELITATEKTKDEVVADAIRKLHASLSKSPKRMSSRVHGAKSATFNDKQLELDM